MTQKMPWSFLYLIEKDKKEQSKNIFLQQHNSKKLIEKHPE